MTDYRTTADSLLRWAHDRDYEGDDLYWKSAERYPMALGYFLRAACALSAQFPHRSFYAEVVEELTSSVLARSNLLGQSRYHHWGLPFPWPTLDDTENALSGDFFWDPDNPRFSGPLPAMSHPRVTRDRFVNGTLSSAQDQLGLASTDANPPRRRASTCSATRATKSA